MVPTAKRIAITGGTGFVGSHLALRLAHDRDHARGPILIGRRDRDAARSSDVRTNMRLTPPDPDLHAIGLDDVTALKRAFDGCDAVAHLAGINRERGAQTYRRVHVEGTRNVVAAAHEAGVRRIAMLSFLRARPNCGSGYHESKWEAEQSLRDTGLDYTILKSGVIWGRGDHLTDHLSRSLHTLPLFATVGFRQPPLRPTYVRDVAEILRAALIDGRLKNRTVYIVGPEVLSMRQIVKRVATACGRRSLVFPMPVLFHRMLGVVVEALMHDPLVSRAQVQMLNEGLTEPAPPCDPLPDDLVPTTMFSVENLRRELPPPRRFGLSDLRLP